MAVDYFLKIKGIEGESQDNKHPKEIQLESWSFGETQTGSFSYGGGGGAGKVQMQDFHFVMKSNKASPKLFQACATGEHIGEAILTARKAGTDQQDFVKWTFSDLLISSYQTGGQSHSDDIPMDSISFNFAKVEIEYKEQDAKGQLGGPIKAGYDLKKMQKV
ncbi:MAG TPA: type VI secretion system tube protein Hcp [Blastocatellia bacterium]|jgi:type VI secretion system secreted protein Hcp|nr:type VI secretion system tube protein Hcp [Blastocatellia bacterium]